ncbi:MAG: hypothetical protein M4D80_41575, partial [Myxococcota bacterium]|nr:hypothetical protein [Myxococcota bacterium]
MSDEDDATAARSLRALGKQLPFDKPDPDRREALRSSLLVAATQGTSSTAVAAAARKRWLLVGGGFAAGALAAAALAIVVISPRESEAPSREAHARIEAPASAKLEHTVTATASGTDEVIRIRAGTVKVAVAGGARKGDRVRMQTADAEVEATGAYEVAVVDDRLERVTVKEGTAHVTTRVGGKQQQVFLAAGQTWRPKIVTADIDLPAAPTPPASMEGWNGKVVAGVGRSKVGAPTSKVEASKVDTSQPNTSTADTKIDGTVEPPKADVATSSKSRTEQHFQAGWNLLRQGKAREAAVELGAAADADASGSDPL